MTGHERAPPPYRLDLDPVNVGAGFGALSGLLAIDLPFFAGLTAALAGLVAVAWAIRPLRAGASSYRGIGVVAIVAGWIAFLLPPPPLVPLRAALLGVSLLPLWYSGGRAIPYGGGGIA